MEKSKQLEKLVEAFERREEIHVGRPLTWALQLGLVALVLTAFWLIYQGAELEDVFVRSVGGFIAFAAAGYAAGRLLEKTPEPQPITFPEKGDSSSDAVPRRLSIDDMRPGMVLAEPARKADGEVLIAENTTLTEELLGVMREYEIPDAVVNLAQEGEENHEQTAGK